MIGTTLILAAGIYSLLRFIRATRGSRLMRGLAIALLVVVVVLVVFLRTSELEVLRHILTRVAGVAAMVFAVLFQPELRRAISQLGEGSFFSRFGRQISRDAIHELVQAVTHMASERIGALIAVEGETPLNAYIEGGVRVDANVGSLLIESVFHPGTALHDGALIIRKDRVAAAACLFPLTENLEIARSTGTRHRAALGLTDETDATVVVVSEETGRISIAQNGVLRADVPVLKLEAVLREALGKNAEAAATGLRTTGWTDLPRAVWTHVRRDWLWIAASLLLGAGAYSVARLQLLVKKEQTLHLASAVRGSANERVPGRFELVVLTPSDDVRVEFEPPLLQTLEVLATPGELSNLLGAGVRGTLNITGTARIRREIALDEIRWEPVIDGVSFGWPDEQAPILEIIPVQTEEITLTPECLEIDESNLNPRFTYGPESIRFTPATLRVEAPAEAWDAWRAERHALAGDAAPLLEFETLTPPRSTTLQFEADLQLSARLLENGFVILPPEPNAAPDSALARVQIEFQPAERRLDVIEKQISLVCLDPSRAAELSQLSLPVSDQMARFAIYTTGLIPANAEPGSPVLAERTAAIMEYLERNLRVFADISELPPTTGQVSVSVQTRGGEKERWTQALENFIPKDLPIGEREGLELRLETAPVILLDRKSN